MSDPLKTDIGLDFAQDGSIDLAMEAGQAECVSGKENLVQALKLRLLMYRGELTGLGHPRHGTVIRDLLGEPMTSANLELLRRYVRKAILADSRVARVESIVVIPRRDLSGAVDVTAVVRAIEGSSAEIELTIDEKQS
ncbi:MAG: DUF2634 domain-containing protein [Deltaproteobacteria bacterium]|nr:DUF2634 domain-containing protein [Deltaproteobacteria bacterium]